MIRLTDDLGISEQNAPISEFPLPMCKKISQEQISNLSGVILSISRDAFNLALALERLEDPDQSHARHLIIDRDGKIFQFAKLTQPIYHLPTLCDRRKINNYNSIAIELINCGKLFRPSDKKIHFNRFSNTGPQTLKLGPESIKSHREENSPVIYYEVLHHQQYTTLTNLLNLLRLRATTRLQIFDCGRWKYMQQFQLPPNFPKSRLGIETSRY